MLITLKQLVMVHQANFVSLLKSNNLTQESQLEREELEHFCKDSKVQTLVLNEMNAVGKKAGLKSLEELKAVVLTSEEWTPASGLLTA
jgi:long-chain acyl-CoA synthetase